MDSYCIDIPNDNAVEMDGWLHDRELTQSMDSLALTARQPKPFAPGSLLELVEGKTDWTDTNAVFFLYNDVELTIMSKDKIVFLDAHKLGSINLPETVFVMKRSKMARDLLISRNIYFTPSDISVNLRVHPDCVKKDRHHPFCNRCIVFGTENELFTCLVNKSQ